MREILFRGKDIAGNWYAGNLAIVKQDVPNCAGTIKAGSYISNEYGLPFAYQVRPDSIGQFTGLVDRNGERIFEGDKIRYIYAHRDGVVIWDDYSCRFIFKSKNGKEPLFLGGKEFEVIGNIHDNPELMGAE